MRTNIVLDDDLVETALKLTGLKTKREVVHRALQELVRREKAKSLFDLAGRIQFADDFDHKRLRELRRVSD